MNQRGEGREQLQSWKYASHQRESLRSEGSGKIGRPSFPPEGWRDSGQNFLSTYRCALRKEFSRSVNLRDADLCKAQEMTSLQDFLESFILESVCDIPGEDRLPSGLAHLLLRWIFVRPEEGLSWLDRGLRSC